MMFLIFISFFIFAFYFRIKCLKKNQLSTDEAFHYYYIDLIKSNRRSIPENNENVLGEGPKACTYPSMYHFILSYLPLDFLKKYGHLTALVYDILSGILLSLFLFKFTKIDFSFYFLITGFFLIFPSLIFPAIGPRSFSLTPRNFSQFLWSCNYLCLLCFLEDQSVFWLQLSATLGALNILSSKFFVQYIILMSLFVSIFTLSANGLFFLMNCFVFAALIGRKRLYQQLKGHIEHSWWYINDGIKFIQVRWQWSIIYRYIKKLKIRDLWQILIFQNPLARGIILNFPLLLCIVFNKDSIGDPLVELSYFIAMGSIFYFILTQFSYFKAFGEPERYLEYSLSSFIFLPVYSYPSFESISFIIIYCLIFCAYIFRIRKNNTSDLNNRNTKEVVEFIKRFGKKRILCTNNNETYLFATCTDKILIGFFINNQKSAFYTYFYHIYPEVNTDNFRSLVVKHEITHIIINKKSTIHNLYDVNGFKKILENNLYQIYTP